jgi:hypothetical protein
MLQAKTINLCSTHPCPNLGAIHMAQEAQMTGPVCTVSPSLKNQRHLAFSQTLRNVKSLGRLSSVPASSPLAQVPLKTPHPATLWQRLADTIQNETPTPDGSVQHIQKAPHEELSLQVRPSELQRNAHEQKCMRLLDEMHVANACPPSRNLV